MSRLALLGLAIALGLGLALRLTSPHEVSDLRPRADALEYDLSSRALAQGQGYGLPLGERIYPPRYTIGFPLLTAALRLVSEDPDVPGHGVVISWLCGAACIALMFLLGNELGGPRTAAASALLLALSPFQVFHARRAMSDAPALAALLLVLWLGLRWARSSKRSARNMALIGLLAGFATMIRLTNAIALPILAILIFRSREDRKSRSPLTPPLIALGIGAFLGLLPQTLVNVGQHGSAWRTGYHYWVPSIYGDGGSSLGSSFAGYGDGEQVERHHAGYYLRKLVAWETLRKDAELVGLARVDGERLARPAVGEDHTLARDHRIEPDDLYPFFIGLLALIGLGIRPREPERERIQRAGLVLFLTAAGLLVFYATYTFRDVRFLLPVQAIVLLFAARVFATRRTALRTGACILVGYALLSSLPAIADGVRPPQGNHIASFPYGTYHEESDTLEWIRQETPGDAILILRTHTTHFEKHLLRDSQRRWIPLGRDEHQIRIDEGDLRDDAPFRVPEGPEREKLASYRFDAIGFPEAVRKLNEFWPIASALPMEIRRERALAILEKLPEEVFTQGTPVEVGDLEHPLRGRLRTQLGQAITEDELNQACKNLAVVGVLHHFANDLDRIGKKLVDRDNLYLCDFYAFEFGELWLYLSEVLSTSQVMPLVATEKPVHRLLLHKWGLTPEARYSRPGFPRNDPAGTVTLYRVSISPRTP